MLIATNLARNINGHIARTADGAIYLARGPIVPGRAIRYLLCRDQAGYTDRYGFYAVDDAAAIVEAEQVLAAGDPWPPLTPGPYLGGDTF